MSGFAPFVGRAAMSLAALALVGCNSTSESGDHLVAANDEQYRSCIARAGGGISLPGSINPKFVEACEAVKAPNPACASALENVARLGLDGTYAAINAARDACEGPRTAGPAYAPPTISLTNYESESEWWEGPGAELKAESSKRLHDRTAFTRANLESITLCFNRGDWEACTSVLRAANEAPEEIEADGYLCVSLASDIASRQAAYNQPGTVETIPANLGKPISVMFDLKPEAIGESAYSCNMELRKSRLPELSTTGN